MDQGGQARGGREPPPRDSGRFIHRHQRPAEELYDVRRDPFQLHNLAGQPAYAEAQQKLSATLESWMKDTADPRVDPKDDRWDSFPYFGGVKAAK